MSFYTIKIDIQNRGCGAATLKCTLSVSNIVYVSSSTKARKIITELEWEKQSPFITHVHFLSFISSLIFSLFYSFMLYCIHMCFRILGNAPFKNSVYCLLLNFLYLRDSQPVGFNPFEGVEWPFKGLPKVIGKHRYLDYVSWQ